MSSQSVRQGADARILHVIASVSPLRGGPSTAIWNTLAALRQQGIEADLVTTDDDGPRNRLDVPLGRFIDYRGHRVCFFPRQTLFYAASWPMLRWLAAHVHQYDVVHAHALFTFAPVVAACVARACRVPYVLRPAGMIERWGRQNRRRAIKRLSVALLEGPLLRKAAAVQFTASSERDQASDLGLDHNSAIIPLAVPLHAARDEPCCFDDEIEGAVKILFLSRLDPVKGMEMLLRALALAIPAQPHALLLVAGDGEAGYVASLRELATSLGIERHVRWLGFVQGPQKHWLLANSAVFALTSWSENFGVAVVEAMAAGLPVIVSRAVGVSDLVAASGAGIVTENTPESIAAALTRVLSSADIRDAMGSAGSRCVNENLTLSVHGKRLRLLYENILDRSAGLEAVAAGEGGA